MMRTRMPLLGLLVWLVTSTGYANPVLDGLVAWRAGDFDTAYRHWRPAAEAGDAQAMFLLSELYAHGKGVAADPAQAVSWLTAAAHAGHPLACYNLGDRYLNGTDVAKDPAQAAYWWRRAAVQGLGQAQYNLGSLYYQGLGVPQDPAQAAWWYQQAAEQGSARAQQALAVLQRNGVTPVEALPAAAASNEGQSEPAGETGQPQASAPAIATAPVPAPIAPASPIPAVDPFALALGPDWLRRQPPGHYTVQVFASNDAAAVTRFLSDYRFSRQVAVYPFEKAGQHWYGVVYGRFASRDEAQAALTGLPLAVQRGRPWVRQLQEVVGILSPNGG